MFLSLVDMSHFLPQSMKATVEQTKIMKITHCGIEYLNYHNMLESRKLKIYDKEY